MIYGLSLLGVLVLFSSYTQFIYGQSNENTVSGRVFPGCALTNNKIYCFGEFTGVSASNGIEYETALNDHIELDLSAIGNFSSVDKSKLQWVNKSNEVDGIPLGKVGQMGTAIVSDGSYLTFGGRNTDNNTHPFAVYHPESNQWKGITFPNDTFYIRTQIVNIGNDQIWIWGGSMSGSVTSSTKYYLYIYDYKSNTWPTKELFSGNVKRDHASTLANNIIYITGGANVNATSSTIINFSIFRTYNTTDATWGSINTTGAKPTNRSLHTTVATDDNKYLIIYGGSRPLNTGYEQFDDVYYVYDIEKNYLQGVNITEPPGSTNTQRFGHYAAIYKSNYLLLVFGYSDINTPCTENFNILNIQNIYQPTWSSFATNTNITNDPIQPPSGPNHRGVDIIAVVPSAVVSVVVVLLTGAIIFVYLRRHRKRKQERQFALEQEDPRKLFDSEKKNNNTNMFSKGTTAIISKPSEGENSFTIGHHNEKSEEHDHLNIPDIKSAEQTDGTLSTHAKNIIKPSEFNT
ncbi:unnamed protein product [Cunninghamella blakesleeana]